jgi:N-acetylmuramoyl-L-alanine amidase
MPARLNSLLKGKQWPIKSTLLEQIRVGQNDASTVRIVFNVGESNKVTTMSLHDPDRLIIDVLGTGSTAPAAPAMTSIPPQPTAAPQPATPVRPTAAAASAPAAATPASTAAPAVSAATAASVPATIPKPVEAPKPDATKPAETKVITAAKATNSGTRSLVRSLGLKLSRVVIDAGHGGHDTGSIGPTGYAEKELVLDVAMRLKQLVETELGAEVVMTRSEDTFVPLETRTAIANEQQADLFISIHANSSRVRSVRGVETYFLNFTSSREALETASRENAASERSIHELQDLVKKIMLRDKVDESRELAQHIQHAMATRKGAGTDRGIKQAPFIVLIGADMPSILAEISFISNPQEERQIKTPAYRQAIAEALFDGVRSYAESLSGTKTAKTQDKEIETK